MIGEATVNALNEASAAAHKPCDCVTKFEQGIVEKQPFTEFKGKKVLKAEFNKALIFNGPDISYKPVLEVELTIEGRKGTVKRGCIYNYCPFCGKPFVAPKVEEVPNGH